MKLLSQFLMRLGRLQHRSRSRRRAPLPDAVRLELVELLFSNLIPLFVMGVAVTGVGILIGQATGDTALLVLTALVPLVTAARTATVMVFQRRLAQHRIGVDFARQWELRYAIGSFVFAALLGAFAARAMSLGYQPAAMLITALIFGHGAGVVTRVSVRPWICIPSLLLAVLPTAAASAFEGTPEHYLHAAILITFMTASFESVRYGYRTTLKQIEIRREMAELARQDDLTGLPNRLLLRERFKNSLRHAQESGTLIGVHYVDLDLFKQVNDRFGHPTGDALLAAVSARLLRLTRDDDTVARLGGDEFLVLQTGISHRDEAEILARRIIRDIGAVYEIGGHSIQVGASVGIAVSPADGITMDGLMARADAALYDSKTLARGGFAFALSRPELAAL